jgi:hypothetical protein
MAIPVRGLRWISLGQAAIPMLSRLAIVIAFALLVLLWSTRSGRTSKPARDRGVIE